MRVARLVEQGDDWRVALTVGTFVIVGAAVVGTFIGVGMRMFMDVNLAMMRMCVRVPVRMGGVRIRLAHCGSGHERTDNKAADDQNESVQHHGGHNPSIDLPPEWLFTIRSEQVP